MSCDIVGTDNMSNSFRRVVPGYNRQTLLFSFRILYFLSVICERARGCPNHVSSFRMSQIRFRVKSQRTGRHVWFTAKTMRQSKDWWVLNKTSFHTQTAHAVTLPFNLSRSHAAFQSLMQSRYLSISHAVTLPFNLSCSHAKRWTVAKVKSRHPTVPVGMQTRDRSGELIRNGSMALSSSSSCILLRASSPNWST